MKTRRIDMVEVIAVQWVIFAVACVLGTVQHFLFEPLGQPKELVFLLPVSESPWEHYKLAFWPLLAGLSVWGIVLHAPLQAVLCAGWAACFHAFCTMEGIYFLYRAGFGAAKPLLYLDIGNYFVTMLYGWRIGLRILPRQFPVLAALPAGAALAACGIFFVYAALQPPKLPLFRDPRL